MMPKRFARRAAVRRCAMYPSKARSSRLHCRCTGSEAGRSGRERLWSMRSEVCWASFDLIEARKGVAATRALLARVLEENSGLPPAMREPINELQDELQEKTSGSPCWIV